MNKQALYEDSPFAGGVSIRGAPTSAEEEISESEVSESEDEVDADFIRHARIVVAVAPVSYRINGIRFPPPV